MKPENISKTAFKMKYGVYEYSVMPFGVSNVPGMFMDYMNRIFHPYLDQFVGVFIDGILIYAKLNEEHVEHQKVIIILQCIKLYFVVSRIKFWFYRKID